MATNLRLGPATEDALRAESARTGRSQQQLIREAIDQYLDIETAHERHDLETLYRSGVILPARSPYRRATDLISLPPGMTSADLLDREDRI